MSEELKPCPICGRRPDLENITRDDRLGNIDCCIIECRMPRPSKDRPRGSCWVKHCVMVVEDTEEQAIAAWNRRVEPIGNPDELPEWLKNIIRGNIEILKPIPDSDGRVHWQIKALEWVLSLQRDK